MDTYKKINPEIIKLQERRDEIILKLNQAWRNKVKEHSVEILNRRLFEINQKIESNTGITKRDVRENANTYFSEMKAMCRNYGIIWLLVKCSELIVQDECQKRVSKKVPTVEVQLKHSKR